MHGVFLSLSLSLSLSLLLYYAVIWFIITVQRLSSCHLYLFIYLLLIAMTSDNIFSLAWHRIYQRPFIYLIIAYEFIYALPLDSVVALGRRDVSEM